MPVFTEISSLNRCEITALIDAFSLSLAKGLSDDDLNTAGNFLVAVGSVMMTYGALKPEGNVEK